MALRGFRETQATLADVAAEAGVSKQTVSNALNNPDLLRPETLRRVQEAIEHLHYQPNRAARNLRTRTSHLIGLRMTPVIDGSASSGFGRFTHQLVTECQAAGYHVLLFPGDPADPELGYADLLRSTAVDAFVITDTYLGNPQAAWLEQAGAHFVAFGRPWDNPSATHAWVDIDGEAGVRAGTEHLIERGHTKIAWIGWRKDSLIGEDRRWGWVSGMRSHGLSTTGLASRVEDTLTSGREAANVLLDEAAPTAFVCASDTLAMGVYHALNDRGLVPGRDVALVGFDDSPAGQLMYPALTSVRPPLEEVAREVVLSLQSLLTLPAKARPGRLLTPRLVVRETS